MLMVSSRDVVVATLFGHRLEFKAGEPLFVPQMAYAAAVAAGALPADASDPTPELAGEIGRFPADEAKQRSVTLIDAIRTMVDENKRGAFTAGGLPSVKWLATATGIQDVTREEMMTAWGVVQGQGQ